MGETVLGPLRDGEEIVADLYRLNLWCGDLSPCHRHLTFGQVGDPVIEKAEDAVGQILIVGTDTVITRDPQIVQSLAKLGDVDSLVLGDVDVRLRPPP